VKLRKAGGSHAFLTWSPSNSHWGGLLQISAAQVSNLTPAFPNKPPSVQRV